MDPQNPDTSDSPETLRAPSLNQLAAAGRSVLTHLQSTHGTTVNASIITRVFLPLAREQFLDCIEKKSAPPSTTTIASSSVNPAELTQRSPSTASAQILNELPPLIERIGRFTDPNGYMQTYLDTYLMELGEFNEDIKVYVLNKLREPIDPEHDYQIVETEENGQYYSTRWEIPLRVVLAVVLATLEDVYTDKWDNDITMPLESSAHIDAQLAQRKVGRDKRINAMHETNRHLMQMGLCHKDVANTWLQSTIGRTGLTLDMEDNNALLKYIREYLMTLPVLQQALTSVQGFRTVLLPWLCTGEMSIPMQAALISGDDNMAHDLQAYVKARYLSELGINTDRAHHAWLAKRIATYCHLSGLIDIECDFTPWLADMARWFARGTTQEPQAKANFQQLSPQIIAWLETDFMPSLPTSSMPSSSSMVSSTSTSSTTTDDAVLTSEAQFYLISRLFDTWDVIATNRHLFDVAFNKSAVLLDYFSQLKQDAQAQKLIEILKTDHGWITLRDNLESFRKDFTSIRQATEKDFIEHFWVNWYAANTPNENGHYDVIDCARLAYTLAELKYRDEGYQFVLGLPSNDAIERGKIYFKAKQNGQLKYKVIAPDGQIITAALALNIDIESPSLLYKLRAMKHSILAETSKRNHTQITSEESRVIELSPTQLDGLLTQIQKAHAAITDEFASAQEQQDGVITLDVYQVNRLLLHAQTTPVVQWTDALALTLQQVIAFIEADFSSQGAVLWNQQALRRDSYPPDLLDMLKLNITAYDAQRRGVTDSATTTPRELFLWQNGLQLFSHILYTPDASPEVIEWLLNKVIYFCISREGNTPYFLNEITPYILAACERGHLGLVEAFIKRGIDLEPTALRRAAEHGHFQVVIRLLKTGMVINNNGYVKGIAAAALSNAATSQHLEAARQLLLAGAPTEPLSSSRRLSPLYIAIANNDDNMVHLLLQHGASIYPKESLYASQEASYQRHAPSVWDLALHKGKLDILISAGKVSPLIAEMLSYHCQLRQAKFAHIRDLESPTKAQHQQQLLNNPWDYIPALQAKATNFNHQDNTGNTALHWAIILDLHNSQVLSTLIQHTDLCLQNQHGLTPLMLAIKQQRMDVARIILAHSPTPITERLMQASANTQPNDVESDTSKAQMDNMQRMLSMQDPRGKTALHLVISGTVEPFRHELLVRLSELGADWNIADSNGGTPLLMIANNTPLDNDVFTAAMRLNPNLQNEQGDTPLMLAIQHEEANVPLICQLIEAGADLSLKDKDGNTALHHAIKAFASEEHQYNLGACDNPIIALLLLHGADMNAQNNNGETPLTWCDILIPCDDLSDDESICLDPAMSDADDHESGHSDPVASAADADEHALAQSDPMINDAIDPTHQNPQATQEETLSNTIIPTTFANWIMFLPWGLNRYPVGLSLRCHDDETVAEKSTCSTQLLADINNHIDMIDEPPWCIVAGEALLVASYDGDIATVQRLLDAGVSPDYSCYQLHALNIAVKNQHIDVVRLLLDRHANPDLSEHIPDARFENTALYHAINSGNDELIALLLEKGTCVQANDHPLYLFGHPIETALHLAIKKQKLSLVIEKAKLSPLMLAIIAYAYEKARLDITVSKPRVKTSINDGDDEDADVIKGQVASSSNNTAIPNDENSDRTQTKPATSAGDAELTKILSRIRLLIQESTDLNHADSSGKTALDWARRVNLTETDIIDELKARTNPHGPESDMGTSNAGSNTAPITSLGPESNTNTNNASSNTTPIASFGHSHSGSLYRAPHRVLSDNVEPTLGCCPLL